MFSRLSPARRRVALGALGLVLVVVAAAVVVAVASREDPVEPTDQSVRGPVILVPGYGGSTAALDVLAAALRRDGREVVVLDPPGDGRGDLRDQAEALDDAARSATADAPSVDVIGRSAGGVVARLWVRGLGGGPLARRVVTLASPNHGTELAAFASGLGSAACPAACRQLATDSDLLRDLDSGDETPAGPRWVAIWTEDDKTVVPPDSGALDGATSFSVQSVCPDLPVGHADVPRTPAVVAMVVDQLDRDSAGVPGKEVCGS